MSLLSELDFEFVIIGISETKIMQMSDTISNFSVPNYYFFPSPLSLMLGVFDLFLLVKISSIIYGINLIYIII